MTEEQIKQLVANEVAKQLESANRTTSNSSSDEVLETIMFKYPRQWGRRVIKRDNEILLQMTSDSGGTWQDAPIPDTKLVLPQVKTRSISNNPYSGLTLLDTTLKARSSENNNTKEVKTEVLNAISSGSLLSKTEDKEGHETVTFLGVFSTSGLSLGQVYQDSQGYLRIVN